MTRTQGEEEAIRKAARRTASHEGIDAVLLYGSRARGDHTVRSDWDVALVTRLDVDDALAAAEAFYEGDLGAARVELTVTSAEWLHHNANTAGTLAARIAREAVLLAGRWTRPEVRAGAELDIDVEMALVWAELATWDGVQAWSWLRIAAWERWPGDNAAAARVQRMAEMTVKGIVATFGVHETDIHDLDVTAHELENAYRDTGWMQRERALLAGQVRALKAKGRAAAHAEAENEIAFEALDVTVTRLGRTWALLIAWLELVAEAWPDHRLETSKAARGIVCGLTHRERDTHKTATEADLAEQVRTTRARAQQLVEKLGDDAPGGTSGCGEE